MHEKEVFFEGKEEVSFLKVPRNGDEKRKNPQPGENISIFAFI